MSASQETPTPAIVALQVLLGNHLKALKLPTFAREYEKVAVESAQDRADYPRYLLRLCELERIDRERHNVGAAHSAGAFPPDQKLRYVRLRRSAVAEQGAGSGTDALRVDRGVRTALRLGHPGPAKRTQSWGWDWPPAKRVTVSPSRPRAALVHELMEARDERRLCALQKHLNTVTLLIVDELGYVPFTAVGSELLFEVFSQRYERGATLVTSNLR
jgi:hypothetical protein